MSIARVQQRAADTYTAVCLYIYSSMSIAHAYSSIDLVPACCGHIYSSMSKARVQQSTDTYTAVCLQRAYSSVDLVQLAARRSARAAAAVRLLLARFREVNDASPPSSMPWQSSSTPAGAKQTSLSS